MARKALLLLLLAAMVLFAGTLCRADDDDDWDDMDDDDDDDGWAMAAPAQRAAQLSTCRAALAKAGAAFGGATVFCPTNGAFLEFAREMRFRGSDPVGAMLASVPGPALKTLLNYHIVPKTVLTAAAIKPGRTPLTTAMGAPLELSKRGSSVDVLHNGEDVDGDVDGPWDDADVEAADLTFDGAFKAGGKFVVHAVDEVMVPRSLLAPLRQIRARNTAGRRLLL
ncbi:MAG: hypothetical protein J3K34DRAFT_525465 [Monoraphidium minutum]|nr:MAG: hypothetical protein J3K34DRAFT_525465 [Monoraphidium minutum]